MYSPRDSIGVGRTGPTHEPVEQLAMLPGDAEHSVFRRRTPQRETAASWCWREQSKPPHRARPRPVKSPQLAGVAKKPSRAATSFLPSARVYAGQHPFWPAVREVSLAIEAPDPASGADGIDVRVVSMPSWVCLTARARLIRRNFAPAACRREWRWKQLTRVSAGRTM